MSASAEALADAAWPDEDILWQLAAFRDAFDVASREVLVGCALDVGDRAFQGYLSRRIGLRREECVLVLYLNHEGIFLAEDFFAGLRCHASSIPARQAVRRAFDLDARRIVLVHNHPSGNPAPSQEDIAATREFRRLLAMVEIVLDDHCIVAGRKVTSMRFLGHF